MNWYKFQIYLFKWEIRWWREAVFKMAFYTSPFAVTWACIAMQVNVVTKVFKIILSSQIISWILHSIYNFLHIINKNNVFNSYSCILIWPIRGPNGHNNNRIYTHLFHQPLDHIPFYTCVKEWESYKSN